MSVATLSSGYMGSLLFPSTFITFLFFFISYINFRSFSSSSFQLCSRLFTFAFFCLPFCYSLLNTVPQFRRFPETCGERLLHTPCPSVRPSVRPHRTWRRPPTSYEISYSEFFDVITSFSSGYTFAGWTPTQCPARGLSHMTCCHI